MENSIQSLTTRQEPNSSMNNVNDCFAFGNSSERTQRQVVDQNPDFKIPESEIREYEMARRRRLNMYALFTNAINRDEKRNETSHDEKTEKKTKTKREPKIVIPRDVLDNAILGDSLAQKQIHDACRSCLKSYVKGEDGEDKLSEVIIMITDNNYKALLDYSNKSEDKDIKDVMLISYLQRIWKRVESKFGAKKYQCSVNDYNNIIVIIRTATNHDIILNADNAWLISDICGLPLVVVFHVHKYHSFV